MSVPVCLGLHVTKCAGTSLITALRSRLSDDEYYFCSSYHENWLTGRLGFGDMAARERLRIVFGHYCHENLLSVFGDRPIFLFTGLREPVACAISRYRHLNVVRAEARREPLSADAFIQGNTNPMCGEILRCFPSLVDQRGPLWQRARTALSLFDFIYRTERFDSDVAVLFDLLEISGGHVATENVSDKRALPDETSRYVAAQCQTIRANDREFLAEDMRLWEVMQPFLSRPWLRVTLADERWALDRDVFSRGLPAPPAATLAFREREQDFLLHEFEEIGKLPELRASLETRIAASQRLLSRCTTDYGTA